MKNRIGKIFALAMVIVIFSGCSPSAKSGNSGNSETGGARDEILFANPGWDSIMFHNAVAGYIAVNVYGYKSWSEVTSTTPIAHEALIKGEIDAHMEEWTDNIVSYQPDVDDGKIVELGVNFDDNNQGFYVPRYVIEGDAERGIEPMAPDLKTVADLAKYKDVFKDDEDPKKGRIYGAIPGWEIDTIMYNKYEYNNLDEDFVYFRPGSQAAMDAAFTSAYDKGEAIVGYYWEPTWLMGKYDFVLLEDEPYVDDESFQAGETECPPVRVTIAASNSFVEKDPEFCEFLSKYKTSSALTSEALSYMQDNKASTNDTAIWFLKTHDELIDEWLDAENAEILRASLE
ncbi:MAG: ABC transporter substrate-binding protein [Lachnospiraceae bacterium]|nr:ABC transporter substrate-binding protein [Lachnospiraceae bacterium]